MNQSAKRLPPERAARAATCRWMRAIGLAVALLALCPGAPAAAPGPIPTDRAWQRLPAPDAGSARATLAAAARTVGAGTVHLAGVDIGGGLLADLARTPEDEPLVRAVRERLGRPVDLPDFLLFLDDVIARAPERAARGDVWMPSGRARSAGILLHPDDVFGDQPRRYGGRRLALFEPEAPADLEPAADGAPLGPRWTARYENPFTEEAMLDALERENPGSFDDRLRDLLHQFRTQGAQAYLYSTVRNPERGYLMYGAFILSRADSQSQVRARVDKLDRLNRAWGLDIPIRWRAPDGWRATIDAARGMANAYNVVYATEYGARHSNHYGGVAVDLAVVDLPRHLTLTAPDDGSARTFDLSAADEPRDLNLTPRLIAWIERHFALEKLRSDYPHWGDAAAQ